MNNKSMHSNSHSERLEETKSNPVQVPIYPTTGSSQRYSSHSERVSEQAAAPVQIPVYQPAASERYSR